MGERLCQDGVLELTCDGVDHDPAYASRASFSGGTIFDQLRAAQRFGWKLWVRAPNGHLGIGHLGPCCSGKAAR